MQFLEINGVEVPCPSVGLEIVISTAVNAGRNAQNEVIAEKFIYERRLIVSLLKQHGIAALLTPPDKLSVNVINKYLELKQQNL